MHVLELDDSATRLIFEYHSMMLITVLRILLMQGSEKRLEDFSVADSWENNVKSSS